MSLGALVRRQPLPITTMETTIQATQPLIDTPLLMQLYLIAILTIMDPIRAALSKGKSHSRLIRKVVGHLT